MTAVGRSLTTAQKVVLAAAFVPMIGTGVAGGIGTYTNISTAYGQGTAVGAVAAGEGATAVLALVLLGLTMLGQSSPAVIRLGLWALPAAASVMSAMAAVSPGEIVIYALTPMGMTTAAEGAAFLARRIVVHRDGRDAEAERQAAAVVQALAYQWARSESHPDKKVRRKSELAAWKLARQVGIGDASLADRLLDVQRDRITTGADAVLARMFTAPDRPALSTGPADPTYPHVLAQSDAERSTSELDESATQPHPVAPDPGPEPSTTPVQSTAPAAPVESARPTPVVAVVAAESARPRRATGRVPDAARNPRPTRTPEQLLDEARSVTADWPDARLTADAIRRAVRTSAERARSLRDTLRAERADAAAEVA